MDTVQEAAELMAHPPAEGVVDSPYMHDKSYIVSYDEDQWLRYDEAGQEFTMQQWARRAEPLKATEVVLRLIPHALFPTNDHTAPYVHRRLQIAPKHDAMRLSVEVTVRVDPMVWEGYNELDQQKCRDLARREAVRRAGGPSLTMALYAGDRLIERVGSCNG